MHQNTQHLSVAKIMAMTFNMASTTKVIYTTHGLCKSLPLLLVPVFASELWGRGFGGPSHAVVRIVITIVIIHRRSAEALSGSLVVVHPRCTVVVTASPHVGTSIVAHTGCTVVVIASPHVGTSIVAHTGCTVVVIASPHVGTSIVAHAGCTVVVIASVVAHTGCAVVIIASPHVVASIIAHTGRIVTGRIVSQAGLYIRQHVQLRIGPDTARKLIALQ